MKVKRIHHVTLAVRDVDAARATFARLFGGVFEHAQDVPEFGVRMLDLSLGDDLIRLASPRDADNPVRRFLHRKGEGFYNIALEVEDLDAAVAELEAQGVNVSDPVEAEPGLRSAFLPMASTHGLSVQLVEVLAPEETAAEREEQPEPAPQRRRPLDLTPEEWWTEE